MSKNKFLDLLGKAIKPPKSSLGVPQKSVQKKSSSYSGKKTHQDKSGKGSRGSFSIIFYKGHFKL